MYSFLKAFLVLIKTYYIVLRNYRFNHQDFLENYNCFKSKGLNYNGNYT